MAETEKKKKPQRNALRSQKLIKKAFAKLLHEKELSKITVSDIVKEANRIITEYQTGRKKNRLSFSFLSFVLGAAAASVICLIVFQIVQLSI